MFHVHGKRHARRLHRLTVIALAVLLVTSGGAMAWFVLGRDMSDMDERCAAIARAYGKTPEPRGHHGFNGTDALVGRVRMLVSLGNYDKAIAVIRDAAAATLNPGLRHRLLAACALGQAGSLVQTVRLNLDAEATERFREMLDLGEAQADWLDEQGADPAGAAFVRGNCAWARAIASAPLNDDPRNGDLQRSLGHLRQAAGHLSRAVDLNPGNDQAWGMYLTAMRRLQTWPELRSAIDRLAQRDTLPPALAALVTGIENTWPSHIDADGRHAGRGEEGEPALERVRMQMENGRKDEAIATLCELALNRPGDLDVFRCLVNAYLSEGDYPSAARTLEKMSRINPAAKTEAAVSTARLYLMLGLREQARDALVRIRLSSLPADADVLLALAQASLILGNREMAERCVGRIPSTSEAFFTAQVLLARARLQRGNLTGARICLDALKRAPHAHTRIAYELADVSMASPVDRQLFAWVEEWILIDELPPDIRAQWLHKRAVAAIDHSDPAAACDALDQLAGLEPNDVRIHVGRVLARLRMNRHHEAVAVYRSLLAMDSQDQWPLLGAALDESVGPIESSDPLNSFLAGMLKPDAEIPPGWTRRKAAMPTVLVSDLDALLSRRRENRPEWNEGCRRLALSVTAMRAGLFGWAEAFASEAADAAPDLVPAYSMWIESRRRSGRDIGDVVVRVQKRIPESGLAVWLGHLRCTAEGRAQEALDMLGTLEDKEPDNPHIRYRRAKLLEKLGKTEEAIKILDELRAKPGPYQTAALNDFAFLATTRDEASLTDAWESAKEALRRAPRDPAVLDTVGWIEHQRGHSEQAREHLTLAVMSSPGEPLIHSHLAEVFRTLGQPVWAFYHEKEASRLASPATAVATLR